METLSFAPGSTILREGDPITQILIISSGSILGTSEKGDLFLKKGDIPGIFDFFGGYSFYTYTASEQVTCLSFPFPGEDGLAKFIKDHPELSDLFSVSMCGQCCSILDDSILQQYNCDRFYSSIVESYTDYSNLCSKYGIIPKQLSEIEDLAPFHTEDSLPDYLSSYYEAVRDLSPETRSALFRSHPEFTYGFIRKASEDLHRVLEYLQLIADYQSDSAHLLLNSNSMDLFDLYTSLCVQVQKKQEDTMSLNATISKLMIQMESQTSISRELYQSRVASYRKQLEDTAAQLEHSEIAAAPDTFPPELVDSVHTILNYIDLPDDKANMFLADLTAYRNTKDHADQGDKAVALRKRLTKTFYELYSSAFQLSMTDASAPLPVKMFLLFGYVDEELAGRENTLSLARIAQSSPADPSKGIYTLYDWLLAIYKGQKEPSRNEFDNDYQQYLHELKFSGKINAETERNMQSDSAGKVMFELQNMFPVVNKTTCGRITTFCPLFSEHNCLRPPAEMLVTVEKLQTALKTIRAIDYSVFFREVLFTMPEAGISHESVQTEVLPDFILMPNIGVRSVLWQEIEGKRRTTPSRMMFSIFCQEDVTMLVTRLAGEFRWEMCKRMQGAHWNDVSDPSLTSEYFDYIQFYKKNNDLSPDAKEKIKIALQRAKNSYREMFVRDYIQWIYYESAGSPRMNKIVRRILFRYCPFTSQIRDKLSVNPLYRELLDRHRVQTSQSLHHLGNVIQKIQKTGKPVPPELEAQQRFLER